MPKSTAAAKEALAYCTSCKMDLNHVIVAMKGEKIAKVQCKTCNKTHTYKAPKGITEPPAKPEKKSRAKNKAAEEAKTVEAEWNRLMNVHKNNPSKNYNIKGQFRLGDKIAHKNFGEGIVEKLIFPNKIEVIFKTDIKKLIHGGIPPEAK